MKPVWINPSLKANPCKKAVFSDRDGTLVKFVDYVNQPEEIELLPGVKDAVQRLIDANIPLFIVTNQSGVGRGYFSLDQVLACQMRLYELLEIRPEQLGGVCIAPEKPGTCADSYRKPSPRYLHEVCKHLRMDTSHCHFIGDTLVDLETAWNAGANAWLVLTGKTTAGPASEVTKGKGTYRTRSSFSACVKSILNESSEIEA